MAISFLNYIKGLVIRDETDATKQLQIETGGGSFKTTLKSSQTSNVTVTLPDATDTLVGKATTDILTNKSLEDSTTSIIDDGDNTKVAKFDVSTITPATTRTFAVPDADTTIIGTDTSQTLTNKTIAASSNTISGLTHGSEVDNPSSGVHGVTGDVVGTTDVQTLTNKTLTSPDIDTPTIDLHIMEQQTTPSNPSAGENKLYFKSDDNLYKLNSAGSEVQVDLGASGANQTLSNLSSPTAVNQDLIPSGSQDLGSNADPWQQVKVGTSGIKLLESSSTQFEIVKSGTNINFNGINTTASHDINIKTGNASAGDSGDMTFTTGTATGTRGKLKFVDGSEGTSGHVWTSTDTAGNGNWAALPTNFGQQEILLHGITGYGSTSTKIVRFQTVVTNVGSDMTLTQSATDGDSVTIDTAGVYAITYSTSNSSGASVVGLSVNASAGEQTTDIFSVGTPVHILTYQQDSSTGNHNNICITGYFAATDVIRAHDDGNNDASKTRFRIVRVN